MALHADKLIASDGGDYTTLQAFETAYDGVDISATDGVKARVKGVPADSNIVYWAGWQAGQDANCKIFVEAESGSECDGTDGSGDDAVIEDRQYLSEATNPLEMEFKNLEFHAVNHGIHCTHQGGGSIYVIKTMFRDAAYSGVIGQNCAAFTLYMGGCLGKALTGSYNALVRSTDSDMTSVVYSTTAYGCTNGFSEASGSMKTRNVAASGSSGSDFSSVGDEDYCASEDNTAGGANSTTALTTNDADDHTAPSTDDFTVYDASSVLYHTGVAIADAWFTSKVATDFAGTTWATPPSIGCFEYAAAGGAINLSASIQAASNTPNVAMNVARALSAAVVASTTTPQCALNVARDLAANIQAQSTTPDIVLANLIELVATIAVSSQTSAVSLPVARNLLSSHAAGTLTSDIALSITRDLAASISAETVTSAIELVIAGLINLAATINAISQTSLPQMAVARELSAQAQAQSTSSALILAVLRDLSGTISAQTQTPDISLANLLALSGSISVQSATSNAALSVLRAISAQISAGTDTSAAVLAVLREMQASMDAATLTSAINLITGGLGVITDAIIESLTTKRTIDSLTTKRTIDSLTINRTIE